MKTKRPIDVVIPWVDGNDPDIIKKHKEYSTNQEDLLLDDVGGIARYTDSREIEICVRSILAFAPFVRNIFIITDGQEPGLNEMLSKYYPDKIDLVKIVDHKDIFNGYDEYLPTFNCNSIETMMWRTPGLSEFFIYFNDDVFLTAPVKESDFFNDNDTPIGYWIPMSIKWLKFLNILRPIRGGHRRLSYKSFMLNSARLASSNRVPVLGHTPYAIRKSILEKIYSENPEFITLNIKDRFRNECQYNPQVLYYILAENEQRSFRDKRLFIKPHAGRKGYMKKKLNKANKLKNLIFGCINSYEQADDEEKALFRQWFDERINNAIVKTD